jgi:hypothetical protein
MPDSVLIYSGAPFPESLGTVAMAVAIFITSMGKWRRRGAVMSTAEWVVRRFGRNPREHAPRIVAAMLDLAITLLIVWVFLAAAEKFVERDVVPRCTSDADCFASYDFAFHCPRYEMRLSSLGGLACPSFSRTGAYLSKTSGNFR